MSGWCRCGPLYQGHRVKIAAAVLLPSCFKHATVTGVEIFLRSSDFLQTFPEPLPLLVVVGVVVVVVVGAVVVVLLLLQLPPPLCQSTSIRLVLHP